ncbi:MULTISPECIES: DUF1599 domain-containing protein [Muribaculum]|jgi:hypothetical protein|uniref:DUF1599 domain-containing protein n=2 Tax=Muribaculum TaxID=1918540 RepID=A0AC61S5K3_9BACT|nr:MULTISPECIES: DUF1599 domain-containing protein [Muribaculum]THG51765.1 DUF1599 domain-containing protein [Muribaculum caecicola]
MKIQTNTPSAEHIQQQQATIQQFDNALARCRDIFVKKLQDYGASWRILRPQSLTDQIYIKANRIRSLETKKESLVGDGILPEFIAIVNYGIIGLIQLEKGFAETADMTAVQATELYDRLAAETRATMIAKNHDYDEAWRLMRVQSYTDIILQKIFRTKQIEDHHGLTLVSEGVDANYQDMINYSIFAIIKLTENA